MYHCSSSADWIKKHITTFYREKERHLADIFVKEIFLPFFTPILFRVLGVLIKPEKYQFGKRVKYILNTKQQLKQNICFSSQLCSAFSGLNLRLEKCDLFS